MSAGVGPVPPIRREVLVDADSVTAFKVFTAHLGRWWPLASLGVYGDGATVAFTGGQIVERSADGQSAVWGTVTRWEPPEVVAFSWEHVAFLNRMGAAGFLVAAGPLADADGEGMTILRLPGSGQLGKATRLATEDDLSVSAGFLAVTVRPWHVIMHPAVSVADGARVAAPAS